jgi:hypothetical protein
VERLGPRRLFAGQTIQRVEVNSLHLHSNSAESAESDCDYHSWRTMRRRRAQGITPPFRRRYQGGDPLTRPDAVHSLLRRKINFFQHRRRWHHRARRFPVLFRRHSDDRHGTRRCFLAHQQMCHIAGQLLLMRKLPRFRDPREHCIRRGLRAVRANPSRNQKPEWPSRCGVEGTFAHFRK